ncbi:hypothetical protein P691DRAFT_802952 [Macrolepiota fuliginosa MF-IS2]|uniref:Fe2OG dioxygenase domain-containing protein n=1 Tax=Macrolepiota fuliginosa MF-IS2 TaxID=1400762 RepID=A0A9P5XC59_9AGAR|nr:hypothetical protein P691DRAFT_802952 [Macrolepiota fuliginosa MF-IS2]
MSTAATTSSSYNGSRMSKSAIKPPHTAQLVDPDQALGAGDSRVVYDLLALDFAETAYEKLVEEVQWIRMMHRGGEVPRLVAQQGEVLDQDGSYPIYRHPADESPPLLPFSPTVQLIREDVQKALNHPVNHVLIQHYRTGADYISDHSDKTIDVIRNSSIVNVSLGAQRVMTLRQKKDRIPKDQERVDRPESTPTTPSADSSPPHVQPPPRFTQRIPLPHNSLFVLGLETNKKWLHGISTDKRPLTTKSPSEQINEGARISLTFRWIGTFINPVHNTIWGIGARGKTCEDARKILDDTTEEGTKEAEKLIWAFGEENQDPEFEWEKWYGEGFDVLHFKSVN